MFVHRLPEICPFWDICATTQLQYQNSQGYIISTCYTSAHIDCVHMVSLGLWPKEEIENIRRRFRERYGKPRYSLIKYVEREDR